MACCSSAISTSGPSDSWSWRASSANPTSRTGLDSPERADSRYASLVVADLLPELRANLPLNGAAAIAGISMGGHGALTLALQHPGLFRSASSISGVVDLTQAAGRSALVELLGPFESERVRWEANSALHLIAARTPATGARCKSPNSALTAI